MLLKGDNGNEFELAIIRDAIPDPQDGFGDAATAIVTFRAATGDEEWEETAPCLNHFELSNLADWLESAAGDSHDEAEIDLLEPELNFQVVKDEGDRATVRIRFRLDARPEELNVDSDTEVRSMDLRVDREWLRSAAASLRSDLRAFLVEPKDDLRGEADDGVIPGLPEVGLAEVDDPHRLDLAAPLADEPAAAEDEENR